MPRQSRGSELPPFMLTRPAAQSDRFAGQLRTRFGEGIRVVLSPLLAPRFLSPEVPDDSFDGVIFTSETGVDAFRLLCAKQKGVAWCVGDQTAEMARRAGFQAVSAGGNAADLLRLLGERKKHLRLLYARGKDTAGDLAADLKRAGIETVELVTYTQEPLPMAGEAQKFLAGYGPLLAPVFSPRSASLLAQDPAIRDHRAALWIAALSPAVAAAMEPARPERVVIAARPDVAAMLDAIFELVATTGPS